MTEQDTRPEPEEHELELEAETVADLEVTDQSAEVVVGGGTGTCVKPTA